MEKEKELEVKLHQDEPREFFVDRKVTIWERAYFKTTDSIDAVVERLKDTPEDFDSHYNIDDYEYLYGTVDSISPEENGGESTEELYLEDGYVLLYDNSIPQEVIEESQKDLEKEVIIQNNENKGGNSDGV